MPKKLEDTTMRVIRRKYEEKHRDARKAMNKVWGTSVPRQFADELDEFLAKHGITKVQLISAGYMALRDQLEKKPDEQ